MAKTVRVTSAQVNAAKLKVKRSTASGRLVSPGVIAIANARRPADRARAQGGSWDVTSAAGRSSGRYRNQSEAVTAGRDVVKGTSGGQADVQGRTGTSQVPDRP